MPVIVAVNSSGSSPLARGTDWLLGCIALLLRFIPAGAGNRKRRGAVTAAKAVHPRWRGEQ